MIIKTYTLSSVSGLYYVAEIDEPLIISDRDPYGKCWYPDIDQWCNDTYGQEDTWGICPRTGWKRMRNKFFFNQQEKLTCFLLRWL